MTSSLRSLIPVALSCTLIPAWGQDLPDGAGKDLVAGMCNTCHPLAARIGSGYTVEGWKTVLRMMVNQGAPVTADHFEYQLPDAGARPRRIAITGDDIVWYTGFARGYLGRLDPASGKVTEWQSPSGPKSEPYGISAINDVIWYSESGSTPNTVVRFDPKTSKFQSWAIPGGGNIVRNRSVTADGDFVLANSLVNTITLVTVPK